MTSSIISLVRLPQITIHVRPTIVGQETIGIISFPVKFAFNLIRTIVPLVLYFLQNIFRDLYFSMETFNTQRKWFFWLAMEKKKSFPISHKSLIIIRLLLQVRWQFARLHLKYKTSLGKVDWYLIVSSVESIPKKSLVFPNRT